MLLCSVRNCVCKRVCKQLRIRVLITLETGTRLAGESKMLRPRAQIIHHTLAILLWCFMLTAYKRHLASHFLLSHFTIVPFLLLDWLDTKAYWEHLYLKMWTKLQPAVKISSCFCTCGIFTAIRKG